MSLVRQKRGQISIIIMVGVLLIFGMVLYFSLWNGGDADAMSPAMANIYNFYDSCIEQQTRAAIDLAQTQAGHINVVYEPGSDYAPFSSQLDFLGFGVPYWYYVSANGVIKEQVPTKGDMEREIADYVQENIERQCGFDVYEQQGFVISRQEPRAEVLIQDNQVDVEVNNAIVISREKQTARKDLHTIEVNSRLGSLYSRARTLYEKQKNEAFLEDYASDVLRLYAPVDGVEITCSPKIWQASKVEEDLKSALEANIASLKLKGDYYTLSNKKRSYFVIDHPITGQANMIYSKNWSTKLEITGANDELLVAQPVGNQQGLSAMGFCYAPYHFVYDLTFPVLIQLSEGEETFQFPVVVIIDNNMPRQAVFSELGETDEETNLCAFMGQDLVVDVFDSDLNKVDASISYQCFETECQLGKTTAGQFNGKAPLCINGYLIAEADGYADKRQLLSTNREMQAEVILDRIYPLMLELEVGGKPLKGTATISFEGEYTRTVLLPSSEDIELSEGLYNITVFVYGNTSIIIPESTKVQCHEVVVGGIAGIFGKTKEECFDIKLPKTTIDTALIGGGKSQQYLLGQDLAKGILKLKVPAVAQPNSLAQLQTNYEAVDHQFVEVEGI